jgi:hypothetical protein
LSNNKTNRILRGEIQPKGSIMVYNLSLTNKQGIVILRDISLNQLDYVAWGPDSTAAGIKRKDFIYANDLSAWSIE